MAEIRQIKFVRYERDATGLLLLDEEGKCVAVPWLCACGKQREGIEWHAGQIVLSCPCENFGDAARSRT